MTDCTHATRDRRRRWLRVAIACGLTLAWTLGGSATAALADGDPASDVLTTQSLFLPQDAGLPAAQQLRLQALITDAAGAGYRLRVALVTSPTDLGSIGELWRQPASYARFLGQELALSYRGTLLVIMPNGFGLFGAGAATARDQAALTRIPLHDSGAGLASTALAAVRQLAPVNGHRLEVPAAVTGSGANAPDSMPWLAFGIGLVLIALAWTASLRARPLSARRRGAHAS